MPEESQLQTFQQPANGKHLISNLKPLHEGCRQSLICPPPCPENLEGKLERQLELSGVKYLSRPAKVRIRERNAAGAGSDKRQRAGLNLLRNGIVVIVGCRTAKVRRGIDRVYLVNVIPVHEVEDVCRQLQPLALAEGERSREAQVNCL